MRVVEIEMRVVEIEMRVVTAIHIQVNGDEVNAE